MYIFLCFQYFLESAIILVLLWLLGWTCFLSLNCWNTIISDVHANHILNGVPNESKLHYQCDQSFLFCVGCSIITPFDILYPTSNIISDVQYTISNIRYTISDIGYTIFDITNWGVWGGGAPSLGPGIVRVIIHVVWVRRGE